MESPNYPRQFPVSNIYSISYNSLSNKFFRPGQSAGGECRQATPGECCLFYPGESSISIIIIIIIIMIIVNNRLSLPPDCSASLTVSRSDKGQASSVFSSCSSTRHPVILTGQKRANVITEN